MASIDSQDRTPPLLAPHDYLAAGEWPWGSLVPSAPVAAFRVAEMCRRVWASLDRISMLDLAGAVGVEIDELAADLVGSAWPHMAVIVSLEEVLGVELWPRWAPGATGP